MTEPTRTNLLEEIEAAYQEIKQTSRNVRGGDRLYDDLDIDSLTAMELLTKIEDDYGIDIVNDPRAAQLTTVDDLLNLVAELIPAADTATQSSNGRPM